MSAPLSQANTELGASCKYTIGKLKQSSIFKQYKSNNASVITFA